jgi:glycine/D-amino acid oxidase-like deaminating enzyme
MHVLICGGGVIGASIAYFLGCRGVKSTVIESTGLACAASGKSGGFLARDWCDGTPLAPLARRSFALHAELNEKLGGNWGYRRLDTYGGLAGFSARRSAYRLGWLSSEVKVDQALGSRDNTAQVHPAQFTTAMMRAALAQGAELRIGCVTAIAQHHGRATGAAVGDEIIEGDAVVVAMGPWSILAAASLPLPAVFGLKGHSLVFATADAVPGEALFIEYREQAGTVLSPEVFPRADGTTYVCAISSETPLPIDPARVAPEPRGDRAPRSDVRLSLACARPGKDPRASSLLSSDHRRWAAADRTRAGSGRRLCRNRAQRLGHSQRAGDG